MLDIRRQYWGVVSSSLFLATIACGGKTGQSASGEGDHAKGGAAAASSGTTLPGTTLPGTIAQGGIGIVSGGASTTSGEMTAPTTVQGGATMLSSSAARTTAVAAGPHDKVDILLTIDNSLAMVDKQRILANGIPRLLRRLTNPDCVDPSGQSASPPSPDPNSACPVGLVREFAPVKDLHVGVISTSLGDFGGDVCPEGAPGTVNEMHNDHAWLIGALPRTAQLLSHEFLSWRPDDGNRYGESIATKGVEFSNFIMAAGDHGCGFEMVMESWYRFLIDPQPTVDVYMENLAPNFRGAVDTTILEQRKRFLRPDSLLVVLMLSDENDCSMKDQGLDVYSWLAMRSAAGSRMWRGSRACESDPNDPCCFSCMLGTTDAKCQQQDPECKFEGADAQLTLIEDPLNMRCRMNKRRFGYDFLFPPSRYVNALTQTTICPQQSYGNLDCSCAEAKAKGLECQPGPSVTNPLYALLDPSYTPSGPVRVGPDSVLLAGVVGVPWQDLARDPSATTLEYKSASELEWDWFAPHLDQDYMVAQLRDPFMIESTAPRSGTHPLTGDEVLPPESLMANSINGHEWYTTNQDVQYACIFSLKAQLVESADATTLCDRTKVCGENDGSEAYAICARQLDWCPCTFIDAGDGTKGPLDPTVSLSPLCQSPSDGKYGNRQYYAGAYPGLRELQVLRGFHQATKSDNAIVGSICPKDLRYEMRYEAGYGYNPALDALVDRMREKLAKAAQ